MAQDVICSVDSCTFWKTGNKCGATMIEVNNHPLDRAYKSDETLCETFRPKTGL